MTDIKNICGLRVITDEWNAIPRPLPSPKSKTRLQMHADDMDAGYPCAGRALQLAAKELQSDAPDMATVIRIVERAAYLLS